MRISSEPTGDELRAIADELDDLRYKLTQVKGGVPAVVGNTLPALIDQFEKWAGDRYVYEARVRGKQR